MPQAIPIIIAGAQAAYSAAVGFIAGPLVGLLGEGGAIAVAQQTVNFALYTGAGVIAGQAFAPDVPKPEYGRTSRKQTVPPRVSGYGTARIGGDFMLWEAVNEFAYNVVASHDGLINGWTKYYLNDKPVTVVGGWVQPGADGRYGDGTLVQIASRVGLPTETRYSQIASTSLWPSTARGDNIASLMMIARAGKAEYFLSDYPNGLPIPSGVTELQLCWDPRLGARGTINTDADKLASATWEWSENPALHLLDYMTNPLTGMGLPVAKFLPRIADWIEAANVCDEPVALAAGGTEPRYKGGGIYLHTTDHADVIATIRSCCDGWLGQDTNGDYTFQAGKYYEPDVIIEDAHIVSARLDRFKKDEESINQVVVTFTDPTFDYSQVETNPIENADEIANSGVIRPQPISLPWVQSSSQAQRLGKIMLYKASAPFSGTITTTLDGLRAWGVRRARIRMPSEGARFADFVADLLPITVNPDLTVTIPFTAYVPETYEWTTAEEGAGPGDDVSPPVTGIDTPVISSVTAFQSDVGGATGIRLRVALGAAGRDDIMYSIRWRVTGETVWNEEAARPAVLVSGVWTVDTGFVPAVASLDVQARATSGGGRSSAWSGTTATNSSYTDSAQVALNAWLDKLTVQPSPTQAARVKTLISSLITAGVWAKMDRLGLHAVHDAQAALVDLRTPTKTIVATSAPVFAVYKGFTGDGVDDKFSLAYNPGAGGLLLTQNSGTFGVWALTDPAVARSMIGTNLNRLTSKDGSSQIGSRSSNAVEELRTVTDGLGLISVARTLAASYRFYRNGTQVSAITKTSAALVSSDWTLLSATGSATFTTAQIAAWYAGSGMTTAEVAAIESALRTYLTAVGAV